MLLEHSTKKNIKAWQTFLNQQKDGDLVTDGVWGPASAKATKNFQSANGLTADGMVGKGTIAKAEAQGFKLPEPLVARSVSTPTNNSNNVFDISHGNTVKSNGFQKAYDSGMRMVFHKATGGFKTVGYHDKKYAARRPQAEAAGLLWGAYHFANGYESGQVQAAGFLDFLKNNGGIENTLIVLDYEPDEYWKTVGDKKVKVTYKDMNLEQARDFVTHIHSETGVYPLLYGAHGKLLIDLIRAGVSADDVLYKCPLWLAKYSTNTPNLSQTHWSEYAFWQYAAQTAPATAGMAAKVDRSFYNLGMGSLADFHKAHSVGKETA